MKYTYILYYIDILYYIIIGCSMYLLIQYWIYNCLNNKMVKYGNKIIKIYLYINRQL